MLVLARLLVPEDFGIIAIAGLFIFFFDVLSNTGIQQYLAQKESVDSEDVDSAWTLDIIIKSVMAFLCLALSPAVGYFYDNPDIGYAVATLSLAIIFRALMNPGLHVMRRNLEYQVIFKISVLQKVLAVAVVISIAAYFKSFWAMIAGDILSALAGVFFSYKYCDIRPSLSKKRIREQWDFSKWMLSRGFVGYARAQIDVFLVSRLFPLNALGQYNLSKEITVMPAFDVIGPAVEPLIATFSKQRYNFDELRKQFSNALLIILLFVSPICFFLFFHSELVISVALGEKWSAAIPITKALSLMLFAFSIGHILNNLFFALGRVKEIFIYDILSLGIIISVLISLTFQDIVDFSYWRGGIALTVTFAFFIYAIYSIQLKLTKVLITLLLPTTCSFAASFTLHHYDYDINIVQFFLIGTLFVLFYILLIFSISFCFKQQSNTCNLIYEQFVKYINTLKIRILKDTD
tara:strand:- start:5863 stop:7251 length:1389 start_codon:yes stop_codon:yes gene_type:complete